MGVLEDCAEFLTVMGAGKAVFRQGSAAEGIDERIADLVADTAVTPRTTTVFVSTMDVRNPRLRDYLRGELDRGLHLTVTVFDHERYTAVDDPELLAQVRDALGVDVTRPGGETPHLTPRTTIAQRDALADLRADPSPPSPAKLSAYLGGRPPGLAGESGWMADHSGLLGVPLALFGQSPGYDLSALDSARPVTRTGLENALNGTFAPAGLAQVVAEIESGRAGAALVHGWAPGADDPEMRWLVRSPDGTARWGVEGEPEFTPFGADDMRTRLLEQPGTTALFLGADGVAYAPEPPPPAPTVVFDRGFHLSVNTRTSGRSALIGDWDFQSPIQRELREHADRLDRDSVLVNVRRGPAVRGLTTLEAPQNRALHSILRNNTEVPVVFATESNDQLSFVTTQRHRRSVIQPVADGFDKIYEVTGPGGQRDRYGTFTPEVTTRATSLARTAPDTVSPEVRALVASNTWADAARFFRDNIDAVRTGEAAEQIVEMIRQYEHLTLAPDHLFGGTVGGSPLFTPDVALPAYHTVVTSAVRAAGDPALAGATPVEPLSGWITQAIAAHSRRIDENFLFGYLTNRPVPLEGAAGDYTMGLIWLREMVQAMLGAATTGLSPAGGLTVIRAKGELDGERASRRARQPEILRAHAVITENLIGILFPDQQLGTAADRQKLLEAIDCLTGEDRVAWLYIVKNQVKPSFPHHDQVLTQLINHIVTCH